MVSGVGWLSGALSTNWVSALVFTVLWGCGGRSSLDEHPDYTADNSGAAGNTPTSSGFDPNRSAAPCANYCQHYAALCPAMLPPGQDCTASCQNQMNSAGSACQKLGIDAMKCLAPALKAPASDTRFCVDAVTDGLNACGDRVDAFTQCAAASGPWTLPVVDPTTCVQRTSESPRSDVSTSTSCRMEFSCSVGDFVVECGQLTENRCNCLWRGGWTIQMTQPNRCLHAAAVCLAMVEPPF